MPTRPAKPINLTFVKGPAMLPEPLPQYADLIEKIRPLCHDEYYKFVFHYDDKHYRTRVEMAGFQGEMKVLDAGCGYGQWAVALAQYNDHIVEIDLSKSMVRISQMYAAEQ